MAFHTPQVAKKGITRFTSLDVGTQDVNLLPPEGTKNWGRKIGVFRAQSFFWLPFYDAGWWFQPSWKILVNGKDYPI